VAGGGSGMSARLDDLAAATPPQAVSVAVINTTLNTNMILFRIKYSFF
jgi:hypothetical protein